MNSPHGLAAWITNEGPDYTEIAKRIADYGEQVRRGALEEAATLFADMPIGPRGGEYHFRASSIVTRIRAVIVDAAEPPKEVPEDPESMK